MKQQLITFVHNTEGGCSVTPEGAMLIQAAGDRLKAIPDVHETLSYIIVAAR